MTKLQKVLFGLLVAATSSLLIFIAIFNSPIDTDNLYSNEFKLGKRITLDELGGTYLISSIPQVNYNNGIPDSSFVIPVKSASEGENLIPHTIIGEYPYWILPGTPDAYTWVHHTKEIIAPNGKYDATKLTVDHAYHSTNMWVNGVELDLDTQYVFSIWYYLTSENTLNDWKISLIDKPNLTTNAPFINKIGKWIRVEIPFIADKNTVKTDWVHIGFDGEVIGDNMYLYRPQIERGSTATKSRETKNGFTSNDSILYAILQPIDGIVNLDEVPRENYNDSELFKRGLEYCKAREDGRIVTWKYDKYLTEGDIEIPESIILKGTKTGAAQAGSHNWKNQRGIVYADLNDSTKTLFKFVFNNPVQGSGQGIKDILIIPISWGNIVIDLGTVYNSICENIQIHQYNNGVGLRYFKTGIRAGKTTAQRISNVNLQLFSEQAMLFENSAAGFVENIRILNSTCGIRQIGGSLLGHDILIEQSSEPAIDFYGSQCLLSFLYTEGIPTNPNTNGIVLNIRKANHFTLENSDINGAKPPAHPEQVAIALDDVLTAFIRGNEIVSSMNNLSTTEKTGVVSWISNDETNPLNLYNSKVYDFDRVILIGNTQKYSPGYDLFLNCIPRLQSSDAYLESSIFMSSIFNGMEFHNDILLNAPTIRSINHNMFSYSEDMSKNWSWRTDRWLVTKDKIEVRYKIPWVIRYYRGLPPLIPGDYYTISFKAKLGIEDHNNNFNKLHIDLGDDRIAKALIYLDTLNKTEYQKYTVTIKLPDNSNPAQFVDFEWHGGDSLDYVYMTELHMEHSRFNGDYVYTNGIPRTANPSLTIPEGTQLEFRGDVSIDTLTVKVIKLIGLDTIIYLN